MNHEVKSSYVILKSLGRLPVSKGPFFGAPATYKTTKETLDLYGGGVIIVIEIFHDDDLRVTSAPDYIARFQEAQHMGAPAQRT